MESHDDQNPTTPEPGDPPRVDEQPPITEPPTTAEQPAAATAAPPTTDPARRLFRSREDRAIAGVCGGLAAYFRIDPVIVRIAAVALVFAGGAGLLLYLAAMLLVPAEGTSSAQREGLTGRALTIGGVVALVVATLVLLPGTGSDWWWGGPFVFLAVVALAALGVWRLVVGDAPRGSGAEIVRRLAIGVGVLALCGLLFVAAAWAGAFGGGIVVAAIVIAAGAGLIVGAFTGGARWLIAPALSIALGLAFVSAAGIDAGNGIGEREYRPQRAADVREAYELGAGQLIVDLRNADLPAGDHDLKIDIGMGEAVVLVPRDVCVASRARIGIGAVDVFARHDTGGVDIDWEELPTAPSGTARLVIDADVGLGVLAVAYERDRFANGGSGAFDDDPVRLAEEPGNDACQGSA